MFRMVNEGKIRVRVAVQSKPHDLATASTMGCTIHFASLKEIEYDDFSVNSDETIVIKRDAPATSLFCSFSFVVC